MPAPCVALAPVAPALAAPLNKPAAFPKPPKAPPNKAPLIGFLPVTAEPKAPTPAPIVIGLRDVCKKF